MGFLARLLGLESKVDYQALKKEGAVIIDVRSPQEFKSGHIYGAKNIPLQALSQKISTLPKNKTIITCCASGSRSGMARRMLKANGFECYNGGGWTNLKNKL